MRAVIAAAAELAKTSRIQAERDILANSAAATLLAFHATDASDEFTDPFPALAGWV